MLKIAQEMGLREKDVQGYLNDALEMQTEFMKNNADAFQQMTFMQHQEMYQQARRAAWGVELKEDGSESRPTRKKPDIFWFREQRACLLAMEAIITRYMNRKAEGSVTMNFTILPNTPLALLATRIAGFADENIQQGS